MNLQEFGKRLQLIRENVLHLSQTELAEKLDSSQVILSRLERGIGADIKSFFVLLNYFTSNNYPTHKLFREQFTLSDFSKQKVSKLGATKKKAPKKDEIFKEFGLRVRTVREDILQMSLKDFSIELNCQTVLYSRIEQGQGGNIHVVFDIVNMLYNYRLDGSVLFQEHFNIKSMHGYEKKTFFKAEIAVILMNLQKSFNAEIERIIEQL